jgi:hypothetical protein
MINKKEIFYLLSFLIFVLFVLISSIVILASVPPVSRDALTHHLAVPKLYLTHGGIYEIPFMECSYNPMNLDLLYLLAMYDGNDIIPKFIHFSFALLTALLIFNYLKRRSSVVYGLLGVIFFLSTPIIVKLSITAYVDLGLIFFSTASLFFLLKWLETGFKLRFLMISGVFSGLAMGTKYNGLITCFLLVLFVPFIFSRYGQDKSRNSFDPVNQALFFSFFALLFFLPWMIRDYIWTNNPIYPLLDQWFNPKSAVPQSPLTLFEFRHHIYHESWWEMALLPVRVFFEGQDGDPRYFDGKLNPFLLLLPVFAFHKIKHGPLPFKTDRKILLAFAVLYFAFAFFSANLRIRYISVIIPPLVILSVFGLKQMFEAVDAFKSRRLHRVGEALVFASVGAAFLLNALYISNQYMIVTPFSYLSGAVSRSEYIEKYRPEYPVMQYINDNLPSESLILFIFLGNRGYYCDRNYVFDMIHNRSTLHQLVIRSDDPEKILLGLKKIGITHLLISHNIFDRWVRSTFNKKDQKLLEDFLTKYIKLLFNKEEYAIYRLEDQSL